MRGVSIILESGVENYYKRFATDIGVYYSKKQSEKEAFEWFEKAFNMKHTNESINNFGFRFMKVFGVTKDLEKAKEIFQIGIEKNDPISMYHTAFILVETDQESSLKYYKKAIDL